MTEVASDRKISEMPHVRGVWLYRSVPFSGEGSTWKTYSCIRSKTPPCGTMRFEARSRAALLRMVDKHLDTGGEINL